MSGAATRIPGVDPDSDWSPRALELEELDPYRSRVLVLRVHGLDVPDPLDDDGLAILGDDDWPDPAVLLARPEVADLRDRLTAWLERTP